MYNVQQNGKDSENETLPCSRLWPQHSPNELVYAVMKGSHYIVTPTREEILVNKSIIILDRIY